MTEAVENTVWARAFVDELARCGLRDVIVAPGSRSTPIVMACAAHPDLRCRVHIDERSVGFFALGVGKATGTPAAVVTTSGTAVANLLPAVVEASQAGVPLLVLTADRPPRLRGADANQAIDQHGIFGSYTRAFHETAAASLDPRALRHHRAVACRAYAATCSADPGPVHVNLPFDKPLEPVVIPEEVGRADPLGVHGRPGGEPFVGIRTGRGVLSDPEIGQTLDGLDLSKAVVVAGLTGDPGADGPAARRLAATLRCPLLADALSGARYGADEREEPIAGFDLFLRDADIRSKLAPTAIFRIGLSPTSAGLQRWLFEHEDVPQLVLGAGGRWKDHGVTATRYLDADVEATVAALSAALTHSPPGRAPSSEAWHELWREADSAARSGSAEGGDPHEGTALRFAAAAVPTDGALFVSSSMPIRDLDAFVHASARPLQVLANRGASGIDGVVSTAFGVASVLTGCVICVVGDLAFFHDQNGLLWSREPDAQVVFVLIDNDGGGIFSMLPIAEHEPDFTTFFATPHGLDFAHAAAQYGMDFSDADIADLPSVLTAAVATERSAVVRVRTDRAGNRSRRSEVATSVVQGVRRALDLEP